MLGVLASTSILKIFSSGIECLPSPMIHPTIVSLLLCFWLCSFGKLQLAKDPLASVCISRNFKDLVMRTWLTEKVVSENFQEQRNLQIWHKEIDLNASHRFLRLHMSMGCPKLRTSKFVDTNYRVSTTRTRRMWHPPK